MKIQVFKEQCKRTCPTLGGGIKLDLAHMVLGMNTEIVELREAIRNKDSVNIQEELSDFLWYFCNYKNFRGYSEYIYDEQEPMSNPMIVYKLYDRVAELQDLIKKFVAYNKEINTEIELFLLNEIYQYILTIAYSYGVDIEDGLEKNIAKLKKRYPEKFDENLAVNRDLETERKILEGDKISN